jgi:hypothetical protein
MRKAVTGDKRKSTDGKDKTINDNGHILCQIHRDRVDMSVCVVRSTRQPDKCKGCPMNL